MKQWAEKYLGYVLIFGAFLIGLSHYGDYGVAWDENDQRHIGRVNYQYVFEGNPEFQTFKDKDYGPVYEMALFAIEKKLDIQDSRDLYRFRHMAGHLFYLLGVLCVFWLIQGLYGQMELSIIGVLLLLFMPHIYAHSFFNSKDIPFASWYIVSFYAIWRVFKRQRWVDYGWAAFALGILINLRIVGMLLFAVTLCFLLVDYFRDRKSGTSDARSLPKLGVFVGLTAAVVFATWPFLWSNPVGNFAEAVRSMSKFRWDGYLLFKGNTIKSTALPLDYLPVWFGITTPVWYMILGFSGMGYAIYRLIKLPRSVFSDTVMRMNFLFLLSFWTPILAVWLLGAVLLDGWRHLFFIYPSFVFLAIFGLDQVLKTRLKPVALGVALVGILSTGYFMVKNAPFQHLYFNFLVNRGEVNKIRKSYEMDYWGTGYKQALDYILERDKSPVIKIAVENFPGKVNVGLLRPDQRARIALVEKRDCTYFITNYRWHPQDYTEIAGNTWYSFKVDNNAFITIFKF